MSERKPKLVFSCEHAVNTIPERFKQFFDEQQNLLNSHRGIDFGAYEVALFLSQAFKAPLFSASVSRLLIDCNRSLTEEDCFSEISTKFSSEAKNQLIQEFYQPYRDEIKECIRSNIDKGYQVWHLSIHSFTPSLNNIERTAELALLYDCKRELEKKLVQRWQREMQKKAKDWRIRLNYPYKGSADGLTTTLRTLFAKEHYLGIEVESNQQLMHYDVLLAKVTNLLHTSLKLCLGGN